MEVDKQFHSRERGSSEGEKAQNDRKDTLKLLGSAQEKKRKDSSCTKGGTAGKGKYIVSITKRNEIIVPPACLEKFWASCLYFASHKLILYFKGLVNPHKVTRL